MAEEILSIEDITSNVVTDGDNKVTGDGVFDKLMETINTHITAQYKANRIKGTDIANMYVAIIPSIMQQSVGFVVQQESVTKDSELKDIQIASAERLLDEDDEKWVINKAIMENQKETTDIDLSYKDETVQKALEQQDRTIESMETDIAFNEAKRVIMEKTRNDNVRMKATEQYAEFLKYISAANAVPSEHHFVNLVGLIEAINDGIDIDDTKYGMVYKYDYRVNSEGEYLDVNDEVTVVPSEYTTYTDDTTAV